MTYNLKLFTLFIFNALLMPNIRRETLQILMCPNVRRTFKVHETGAKILIRPPLNFSSGKSRKRAGELAKT